MTAILTKDPEELSRPGLDVPGGLERIVRRCLEKDPAERFQSAKDVAFALEAESGTGQSARAGAPAALRQGWRRPGIVAALVAVGALAGAAFVLWRRPPAVPRVTAIRQVTHDRMMKGEIQTDGSRIYYGAVVGLSMALQQAPVSGGDAVRLECPLRQPLILDLLPSATSCWSGRALGSTLSTPSGASPLWEAARVLLEKSRPPLPRGAPMVSKSSTPPGMMSSWPEAMGLAHDVS